MSERFVLIDQNEADEEIQTKSHTQTEKWKDQCKQFSLVELKSDGNQFHEFDIGPYVLRSSEKAIV